MNVDPNSNFGRHYDKSKPVRDLTSATDYPSVKAASAATGIPPNQISGAIHRNGTVHGHKFINI